jgi:hypothetical protein
VISKCANPKCPAVFRYLHEGRLFEFEVRSFNEMSTAPSMDGTRDKPAREIECFWLCDACASTMSLVRKPHTHEVIVVPLHEGIQEDKCASNSAIDEQSPDGSQV